MSVNQTGFNWPPTGPTNREVEPEIELEPERLREILELMSRAMVAVVRIAEEDETDARTTEAHA